jgi:hypothetical protein
LAAFIAREVCRGLIAVHALRGTDVASMNSKKENVMALKTQVANVVDQIQRQADELPERVTEVTKALAGWGGEVQRFTGKNPGAVLVGAFAIGFILAKVARHV